MADPRTPTALLAATNSENAALIDAVRAGGLPMPVPMLDPHTGKLVMLLTLPRGDGRVVENVENILHQYRDAPLRRTGTAKLADLDSLIAHANRFKDAGSALYADPSKPDLTVILNYHEPTRVAHIPVVDGTKPGPATRQAAEPRGEKEGSPRWGNHRGVYGFPLSREWKAWTAQNATAMGQADFAAFLEDRIQDVIDPPAPDTGGTHKPSQADLDLLEIAAKVQGKFCGADRLMTLSRGLTVKVNAHVEAATSLSSGEGVITFQENHLDTSGNKLTVPSLFLIAIPVFERGPLYRIAVRLRYRVGGGAVKWFYELWHHEESKDHHYREQCQAAAQATGLPLFYGVPE